MDYSLIFIAAIITFVFGLLVLFVNFHKILNFVLLTVFFVSFLLFGYSIWTSQSIRSAFLNQESRPAASPYDSHILLKESVLLDIPVISQLPELPRGCEVTSLAMLLQHAGVHMDKMELAERIKKDPTPYQLKNGRVNFGNPNVGFVGDMYTLNKPGYGVYHKPIKELADRYLSNRAVDFTGSDFSKIETILSNGIPVWIIINSWYKELPTEQFRKWKTPVGEVQITYREHSVLVTGYDKDYVYVNDPLTVEKNKKVPKQNFIKAWVQMGSQAITYVNS